MLHLLCEFAITAISVCSGNEAGLSEPAVAFDSGDNNDPNGLAPNHVIKDGLPTPKLKLVQRLDLTRVKIEWDCGLPTLLPMDFQFVKLILFRQSGTGIWERIHTVSPWTPSGTFEDTAAPIATLLRYSAITEYVNPGKPGDNAGSDAAPYRELDYGPATYGMKGRRVGDPDHSLQAPRHDLTGSEPRRDRFTTVALSFDSQSPSFIPTNPALPPNTVAPLDFVKEEGRFFPEGGNETELSTAGYVICGRKFNIHGLALIAEDYNACWLGFPPLPSAPQPLRKGSVGTGALQKAKYKLDSTPIQFLGTRYRAPA